jgi:two-component system OmpR family sensor kinase
MKQQMFSSIRGRLTLWYALVLGLVFLVSDVILYEGFRISLLDTTDHTLLTAAEEAQAAIERVPPKKWRENIKQVERGFVVNRLFIQLIELPTNTGDPLQLVAKSGILSGNISLREVWERFSNRLIEDSGQPIYMNINVKTPGSHPMRLILYPIQPEGGPKYLIQVGTSLKKMFHTLDKFFIILVLSAPVLLFISVLGGYFILTQALRPVELVVQTARKITTEDLSLRIPSNNRKDEIGRLITTLNRMISRLELSVSQIKQFSTDASHDLKTPLTIIRGEIDIALRKKRTPSEYRRTLASVHEESQKLETVIDNLLFLSRIEAQDHRASFQDVSLDGVLLEAFEKTARLAGEKHIAYDVIKVEPVTIPGNAVLLGRLVLNLLENAIKYTPEGGKIEMSLENDDEYARLRVQDTGIGIPSESLPFIFDRFYRVDKSRSQTTGGSGLGLSIVKQIADFHRAEISIQSQPCKGTTFHVQFLLKNPK